jgi:hypothetical protein
METILCPTDFSASSLNAIHYADDLATRMNMRLVLFHNIAAPVVQELVSSETTPVRETWPKQGRCLSKDTGEKWLFAIPYSAECI